MPALKLQLKHMKGRSGAKKRRLLDAFSESHLSYLFTKYFGTKARKRKALQQSLTAASQPSQMSISPYASQSSQQSLGISSLTNDSDFLALKEDFDENILSEFDDGYDQLI